MQSLEIILSGWVLTLTTHFYSGLHGEVIQVLSPDLQYVDHCTVSVRAQVLQAESDELDGRRVGAHHPVLRHWRGLAGHLSCHLA